MAVAGEEPVPFDLVFPPLEDGVVVDDDDAAVG
jgi:hypothetical protein